MVGTSNNQINLWDLNSDLTSYEYSINAHALWVTCLIKIDNKRFASSSNDSKIKIWDYYTHECLKELNDHTDCILSLIILKSGNLCTGSADNTIKIWDTERGECVITLIGHEKWVKCLYELDCGIILSGSENFMPNK